MQSYRTVFLVTISTVCFAIVTCFTIPSRAFADSTSITKWKNNKSGAASLTFDDGYQAHYSIGVTALDELAFKGTFFVVTERVGLPGEPSWDNWRSAASSGHEIGSHTKTHPRLPTLPDAEMRREILDSQAAIDNQIDSQDCLTFAYPFGDGAGYYNIQAIVDSAYIGARGISGGLNSFPFDFYNARVWFPDTVDGSLEYQADLAETRGNWLIAGFHSLDGAGYGPITEANFRQFLNHIKTKNLWVDTFGAVTRYIRERDSASLYVVSSSSNGMVLNLTDSLNDIDYDEELTIRSEVPSNCVSALVAQGSKSTTVISTLEGSTKVIYFNAIPDQGAISVTFTTAPIALSALSVSPASVVGGFSATGTVTLSGPAPSGGVAVSLSDNSTAVSVPANVTVPAGSSSATFEITTSTVNSSTSVSISAAYGGATRTATLTVTPVPVTLSTLSVSPASVVGGFSAHGTVTLSGPAPSGGVAVSLSDNSTAVSVPTNVTVPAGSSSATFEITTSTVNSSTSVSISAAYGGVTKSAVITFTSNPRNSLPIAADDTYSTTENISINIAAPGVLSNDTDPENESLRTVLVSGPSHGILMLNSNGSFSFTPAANYIGNDSFTYMANNGINSSNVATVTITVDSVLIVTGSGGPGAGGGGGGAGGCFITSAINADDPSWLPIY